MDQGLAKVLFVFVDFSNVKDLITSQSSLRFRITYSLDKEFVQALNCREQELVSISTLSIVIYAGKTSADLGAGKTVKIQDYQQGILSSNLVSSRVYCRAIDSNEFLRSKTHRLAISN